LPLAHSAALDFVIADAIPRLASTHLLKRTLVDKNCMSVNPLGDVRPVILCIDEEENALEIRKQVLESAGYRVMTASNPSVALEILRKQHVDLALTEHIPLPIAGSPTLAAIIKKLKPEIPLALYSAEWEPAPRETQVVDIFITKLASVDELLHTIQSLLDGASVRTAA
jgi:CheY-like chemotaxis protein